MQQHFPIDEKTYTAYETALLSGNKSLCINIIAQLLQQKVDIKILYEAIFMRSLYKVGELWEKNQISVAVEHLATGITSSVMNLVYPLLFSVERTNHKAVISTIHNEYHQIGARMVADIFELNGWDSYFLGANTPVRDLNGFIADKQPDVLALSVSISHHLPLLDDLLNDITKQYPRLRIIVGGQAFRYQQHDVLQNFPRAKHVASLNDLETYLKNF